MKRLFVNFYKKRSILILISIVSSILYMVLDASIFGLVINRVESLDFRGVVVFTISIFLLLFILNKKYPRRKISSNLYQDFSLLKEINIRSNITLKLERDERDDQIPR